MYMFSLQTKNLAVTTLEKLAEPAWGTMQAAAEKVGEKIEPTIRKGVGPIYKAKNEVKAKISSASPFSFEKKISNQMREITRFSSITTSLFVLQVEFPARLERCWGNW